MTQENEQFDPVQFGIGVMKDHEHKLFDLIRAINQQPINNYTDRDGNLDRQLVSQQIAIRSTLILNLSNQLGRLQMALYALACQRIGVDYGEILNEMTEATTEYEEAMDALHAKATSKLPLAAEQPPEPGTQCPTGEAGEPGEPGIGAEDPDPHEGDPIDRDHSTHDES